MKTQHKHIYYRKDWDKYFVRMTIQKEVIYGQPRKTLLEALNDRTTMYKQYGLSEDLLLDAKKPRTEPDTVLFGESMLRWWAGYRRGLEVQTVANYELYISKRILPYFAPLPADKVTSVVIQDYVDGLGKQGLKTSYIKNLVIVIKDFYADRYRKSERQNPCKDLIYPKPVKKPKKVFSASEKQKLYSYLKAMGESVLYVLFRLAFESGLRRGELGALTLESLDEENCMITIHQVCVYDKSLRRWVIKPYPKTFAGNRSVPVSGRMMLMLRSLAVKRKYIFGREDGSLPSLAVMSNKFRDSCKSAGIKGSCSIHCTRHTWATDIVSAGVALNIVQGLGGWSTPRTVLAVYAAVGTRNQARAAMEKVFF